jgi:ATP-dependent exoDNAse (exonuclease V) alpha subunit
MAIYHLHVRFVQRSKGRSSVAASAYRAGEKLRDERTGELFDFTHKAHVAYKEILTPEHLPERLRDRGTLWNEVEAGLKRKDAQPAFEVEVALPRELSAEKRIELVRAFALEHFVKQGLVVDVCIHNDRASDGGDHPHCHMLVTTRRWQDDGTMGKAARDLQDSPALLKKVYALEQEGKLDDALLAAKGTNLAGWRKAWADYSNDFLAGGGHDARIDHRTLIAQKIDREPMPHIGFAIYREGERLKGWLAERVEKFTELRHFQRLRSQFERIRDTRRDLTAEFVAMAREHAKDLAELMPGSREKGAEYDR